MTTVRPQLVELVRPPPPDHRIIAILSEFGGMGISAAPVERAHIGPAYRAN
jgi:hypothetical protein